MSYGLTAQTQDNGYACKNNIGSGILVGKETTEAKQLRDNKMACNERDVTKTESDFCSAEKVIQIEKVNDSSSSKNCEGIVCEADATVQQQSQTNNSFKTEEERCKIQVDEQVTSSCSSDEEIFSRKAKQKKVCLLFENTLFCPMQPICTTEPPGCTKPRPQNYINLLKVITDQ